MLSWFDDHDPFDANEPLLKSIASGLTASPTDNINCDDAESAGREIQEKLNLVPFIDVTIKRSDKVHTLEELQPGIKLDKKSVHIDPNILFTRLISILGTVDNISEYFEYELTPEPTSLFKDSMMRKSAKSTLRNQLMDQVEPSDEVDANVCVVDGGALLHKVYWPPNSTYGDVFHQYTQYIQRRYRNYQSINVVFDGYADKNSTKTHEQIRRGSTLAANIEIYKDAKVTSSREAFLRNPRNKEQFIKILSQDLSIIGCHIQQAVSDADILIVCRALELASENNVVVFADDTDIFVLLCYHLNENQQQIYVATERGSKEKNGKSLQYWNINDVVDQLENRKLILFSHAWSGCDTTSAMFQQGKLKVLQMLQCDENKALANKFGNFETSQDDVANAGCRFLIKRYLFWFSMTVTFILIKFLNALAFLCINVMINNAVEPGQSGFVNGLAMIVSTTGRAIAVSSIGSMFGWSLTNVKDVETNVNPLGFPFNQYFTFLLISIVSLGTVIYALFLPKSLDKKLVVKK